MYDTYTESGASAIDNYDGNISSSIVTSGAVDTSVVDTYTLTYDITDANGNSATTVSRTVVVEDTIAPVIALNGQANLTLEVGTAYYR